MFTFCTDQVEVKKFATSLIGKHDDKFIKQIVDKDDILNANHERSIDAKLEKWRLKERKHEFQEQINLLQIREMLPKSMIQSKLKQLDDNDAILRDKEGDKKLEATLGVKLPNRYFSVKHYDDPLPGEDAEKEKSYWEKKRERLETEGKSKEEINQLLDKLKEEKRVRREKKRKDRIER